MFVFQCPECALRFLTSSELEQHLAADHPDFQAQIHSLDDVLAAARRRHAPGGRSHESTP